MQQAVKTLRVLRAVHDGSMRDLHIQPPGRKGGGLCHFRGPLDVFRAFDHFGYKPRCVGL
jgi:hypothetical protein